MTRRGRTTTTRTRATDEPAAIERAAPWLRLLTPGGVAAIIPLLIWAVGQLGDISQHTSQNCNATKQLAANQRAAIALNPAFDKKTRQALGRVKVPKC